MPRKLGQHFLTNEGKLEEIASALELSSHEMVIEIGPGHGELTKHLLTHAKVTAIEKDSALAERLKKTLGGNDNLRIIEGDARELLGGLAHTLKTYKIAGNIPYSLTGRLLRIFSGLKPKPTLTVITIQKEVAERAAAAPPRMNILAASVQIWAKPEIVDYISKKDFAPPPKVDSAIIKLRTLETTDRHVPVAAYYAFIKILFKQPRKTVLNNLSVVFSKEKTLDALQKNGIPPQSRPQNLAIEEIASLSRELVAEGV